ncbi:uncharacterized protein LOC134039580 isoform X2 [Osmerus eperlanus]|uniref:uncharacterized protein LOC134039580 isoform X2 n=1 Tax=Osmerus eperlanus TaxID=29151 RepID=UPI002E0F2170
MIWYGVLITLSYNYECFQPPCSCNPATKRNWEQVKVKHKNIIQAANKKKADMLKTGGGPRGPELTPAEELALANNRGRPIMQGIAGGSSSGEVVAGENPYVQVAGGSITLLQPPPNVLLVRGEEPTDEVGLDDEDTLSAFSSDLANPAGPRPAPPEPGPSRSLGTGDGETDTEDVRTLYKRYLRAKIHNLHLSSMKLDLEVKLLKRQLNDNQ